jgi:hypothetical protein
MLLVVGQADVGSNPTPPFCPHSSMVEQRTFNPKVAGSSPAGGIMHDRTVVAAIYFWDKQQAAVYCQRCYIAAGWVNAYGREGNLTVYKNYSFPSSSIRRIEWTEGQEPVSAPSKD